MTTQDPPVPGPPEPERPDEEPGEEPDRESEMPRYDAYGPESVPPPPPPPQDYDGGGPLHAQPRNGLGMAALVCGIIAVALSFIPGVNIFTWPLGVLAIVFGAVGWARANKGQATNKGQAIAGLVLGIASFFTFCLIYVLIGANSSVDYNAAPLL